MEREVFCIQWDALLRGYGLFPLLTALPLIGCLSKLQRLPPKSLQSGPAHLRGLLIRLPQATDWEMWSSLLLLLLLNWKRERGQRGSGMGRRVQN